MKTAGVAAVFLCLIIAGINFSCAGMQLTYSSRISNPDSLKKLDYDSIARSLESTMEKNNVRIKNRDVFREEGLIKIGGEPKSGGKDYILVRISAKKCSYKDGDYSNPCLLDFSIWHTMGNSPGAARIDSAIKNAFDSALGTR
ncbi:MAG: hypothetical protein MUD12_17255 [Spirochaetes bacterium]|jgi:hypothetical protein|nr:hypothetical protein [Spirochaetota bacterium]